jgi:molecular chaperone GrpE
MDDLTPDRDEEFELSTNDIDTDVNLSPIVDDIDDTQEIRIVEHPGGATGAPDLDRLESLLGDLQVDLRRGLIALGQRVTKLDQQFETKILYDKSKDQTIDALHDELQDYRDGLQFKHLRPLVDDLLTVYDDLSTLLVRFWVENPDQAASEPVKTLLHSLDTIRDDLAYTLEKHGFELYEHPGDEIDRQNQRVQGTVETNDPVLDRKLAERVRRGLRYEDRVIRPEVVRAYKFVPLEDDAAE